MRSTSIRSISGRLAPPSTGTAYRRERRIVELKRSSRAWSPTRCTRLTGSSAATQPVDPRGSASSAPAMRSHGDYTCNIALRLAKTQRAARRASWPQAIVAALPASPLLARAQVAGAGFINFHLRRCGQPRRAAAHPCRAASATAKATSGAAQTRDARVRLGQSDRTAARRPRPPGRLRRDAREPAARHRPRVQREYYINDAGRQMDILDVSTWLRYLERCGEQLAFPVQRLSRRLRARASRATLLERQADASCIGRSAVLADLPPDAPGGRQGAVHRCADRSACARCSAPASSRCSSWRWPRCSRTSARI